jgi:hypothetical protein
MLIRKAFCSRVIRFGLFVAATRIGVIWYLFIRRAMGQENLDELLLILLLYPEGLLFPNRPLTVTMSIVFSGALLIGSLCMTAVILAMLRVALDFRFNLKEP